MHVNQTSVRKNNHEQQQTIKLYESTIVQAIDTEHKTQSQFALGKNSTTSATACCQLLTRGSV